MQAILKSEVCQKLRFTAPFMLYSVVWIAIFAHQLTLIPGYGDNCCAYEDSGQWLATECGNASGLQNVVDVSEKFR
jgi:hypothetical protein